MTIVLLVYLLSPLSSSFVSLVARLPWHRPVETRDRPLIHRCIYNYRVVLTFDDGPHPVHTPAVLKILDRHRIRGGFFALGTSIQNYLSYHNVSTVHQTERPRLGFLLLQNYSSIEELYDGHEIFLHGWMHEKNDEMRLHPLIENIVTQWIEIGSLRGFQPIYRAPWGIGSTHRPGQRHTVLARILRELGIVPISWDVSTGDYLHDFADDDLIRSTLKNICQQNGGIVLLHDNRPRTVNVLDRLIRSIRRSGHSIVDLRRLHRRWNDKGHWNRTRAFVEHLRDEVRRMQEKHGRGATIKGAPDIIHIAFEPTDNRSVLPSIIDPLQHFIGEIRVRPTITNLSSSTLLLNYTQLN